MAKTNTLPESLRAALHDGEALLRDIEETAIKLSCLLTLAHGGSFSVDIDHKSQFVTICQDDFGRGAIVPKRGEGV
jgi:hypothetical protein